MNIQLLESIKKLCQEYYKNSPTPLQDFAYTLKGKDKEILLALLRGEERETADATLIRCKQILSIRKNNPNNPYGKYYKK